MEGNKEEAELNLCMARRGFGLTWEMLLQCQVVHSCFVSRVHEDTNGWCTVRNGLNVFLGRENGNLHWVFVRVQKGAKVRLDDLWYKRDFLSLCWNKLPTKLPESRDLPLSAHSRWVAVVLFMTKIFLVASMSLLCRVQPVPNKIS